MSDRQQKIGKLRAFLTRPEHCGGIYLISGQRGVGKSWLVDRVLTPGVEKRWYHCWSGRIGRRSRFIEASQPRNLQRVFLKVDVDPMFPIMRKSSGSDQPKESEPTPNELTVQLLLNVICALTNAIDTRFSIRSYGRVLRERLGFYQYWIGNALLWPASSNKTWPAGLVLGLVILLTSALAYRFYPHEFRCWRHNHLLGQYILSGVLATVICWFILRWLDWRALQNISDKLYNVAHSSHYQQKQDKSDDIKNNHGLNLSPLLSLALLFSLAWLVFPTDLEDLYQAITRFLSEVKNPTVISALVPIVLILSLVYTRERKHHDEDNVIFDQSNPAWLINLLRRYLFLCHRCGLEPVLVLDELDKLDDWEGFAKKATHPEPKSATSAKWIIRGYSDTVENHTTHASQYSENQGRELYSLEQSKEQPRKPDKLNLFLLALLRLKASLGAEFFWILIGGQSIHELLQQDRHAREDGNLGLLATLISQEDVLGPVTSETAEDYVVNVWQPKWDQMATDRKWDSKLNHHHFDLLWLRCYGNFATLIRECENLNSYFEVSEFHKKLINTINELWEIDSINEFLNYHQTEVLDAVRNDWIYIGIRSGILEAGNRLIKPILPDRGYFLALDRMLDERNQQSPSPLYDKRLLAEIHAIRSTDPEMLRATGAMLLYKQLKRNKLIRDIGKDKIEIIR